jgi:prevent-host-death family protein
MLTTSTLTNARSHLGELVARARHGHERIVITEHGRPAAVIISFADLEALQHAEDTADIAAAAARQASGSALVPHADVVAMIDAMDAADQ